MAAPNSTMELDNIEWELVIDDDFVYKRPKRPRLDPTTSSAPPPPDPAAEERNRRERKKKMLLKLKTRYRQEIHQWEHLSNTLNTLQQRTQNQRPPLLPDQPIVVSTLSTEQSWDSTYVQLADTLLAQAEAQEATIREVSRLCDVAEALCSAQEERIKHPFIDLPIWEPSPRELMASLCED